MAQRKYSTIVPFGLRLQPELKEKLEAFARQNAVARNAKPSLNAEIVERLEHSLKSRHELDVFTDGELIDELIRRWGRDRVFIRLGKDLTSES